jgi:hypothetical protein
VGSNPARGMDVCLRLFCVCVVLCIAALRRADHSSKESYQMSISVRLRNLIRGGQGPKWAGAPLKKKYKTMVFSDESPCNLRDVCQRFGGT